MIDFKNFLKCENCGSDEPKVERVLNPYAKEVLQVEANCTLCENCYDEIKGMIRIES